MAAHARRSSDRDTPGPATKTCRSIAPRIWLAAFALVMFILCFSPVPDRAGGSRGR